MKSFDPYGRIRVSDIQGAIVRNFQCNPTKFYSTCRDRDVSQPRQIAMMLARELTAYSLPQIGRFFHRDHTTIIHGISAAEKRVANDPELARKVNSIRTVLETNHKTKGKPETFRAPTGSASVRLLMRSLQHIDEPAARKTVIVSKWERQELSTDDAMQLIHDLDLVNA